MRCLRTVLILVCLAVFLPAAVSAEPADAREDWDGRIDTLVASMRRYYEAAGEAEKIAPYGEPISVSYVNYYEPMTRDAMNIFTEKYGETWDRTRWTEAAKRLYNVDLTANWWVADHQYEQKLRMDIISGELPDVFLVPRQEDLRELAESGKIWDLSELYEQYATRMDKVSWESDGGYLLKMATFGDRLYGIPAGLSDTDLVSYLWIRRDWLERLKLEAPATLEELKAVMDAFMAADFDGNGKKDTVGLGIDKDLFYTTRGIFAAFGAYPEYWEQSVILNLHPYVKDGVISSISYYKKIDNGIYTRHSKEKSLTSKDIKIFKNLLDECTVSEAGEILDELLSKPLPDCWTVAKTTNKTITLRKESEKLSIPREYAELVIDIGRTIPDILDNRDFWRVNAKKLRCKYMEGLLVLLSNFNKEAYPTHHIFFIFATVKFAFPTFECFFYIYNNSYFTLSRLSLNIRYSFYLFIIY